MLARKSKESTPGYALLAHITYVYGGTLSQAQGPSAVISGASEQHGEREVRGKMQQITFYHGGKNTVTGKGNEMQCTSQSLVHLGPGCQWFLEGKSKFQQGNWIWPKHGILQCYQAAFIECFITLSTEVIISMWLAFSTIMASEVIKL